MVTRVNPRQVSGVEEETLKTELLELHKNIGYFLGSVRYVLDLATLTPKIGNVAFVQSERMWFYWDGIDWKSTGGPGSGGPASPLNISQVTKLNLIGLSETKPRVVDIIVPFTDDFRRTAVEVLKFRGTQDDVVSTVVDYVNTDEFDFQPDGHIEFDGSMSLKTKYFRELQLQEGAVTRGLLYTIPMDVNEFKKINSVTIK